VEADPKSVPGYDRMLRDYFPKHIQQTYPDDITGHMLADEIAMTVATTNTMADAGCALIPIMLESTGASVPAIVSALFKAQRLARTEESRATLEELRSTVDLEPLYSSWVKLVEGCRMVALYWLSARGRVPHENELDSMRAAVDEVFAKQNTTELTRNRQRILDLVRSGVPQAVAADVLKAQYLNIALMVWSESRRTNSALSEMIVRNVAVGRASGLLAVIDGLAGRPATGQWEPIALQILYIRYLQLLRSLVVRVEVEGRLGTVDELQPKLEAGPLRAVRAQVDALLSDEAEPSVATLLVLEERVAAAIARLGD
jgi:NAD-specific glutamate dehydrogenase